MPKTTVNGVRINYQQAGSGPDLVLLHGLAADLSFWFFRFVPQLQRRFRVTVYDLRGHGYSEVPADGYTTSALSDDLAALLDHLGIRRAHLAGHSYGGSVALHAAARWPERVLSLGLIDCRINALQPIPLFGDEGNWDARRRRLRDLGVAVEDSAPRVITMLLEEMYFLVDSGPPSDGMVAGFAPWKPGNRMDRRLKRLREETTFLQDVRAVSGLNEKIIRRVAAPTLLSYGERSRCLPSCHALQKRLPRHRTVIHQGVGHFFPALKPDLLLDDLLEFYQENDFAGTAAAV